MRPCIPSALLCISVTATFFFALTAAPSPARAGEKKIEIKEHLGLAWSNQLVEVNIEAAAGQCGLDGMTLIGPRGPVAVQPVAVEFHPGTASAKSMQLAFVVDQLPAQGANVYTLTYRPPAKDATTQPSAAPASGQPPMDLKATTDGKQAEVANAKFGLRAALGEKVFDPPITPADVPGPIAAMRLTDGAWFGGSKLYGKTAIKAWSSRLTMAGPVVARIETTYTYADGRVLTIHSQLAASDGAATVEMNVTGGPVSKFDNDPIKQADADGWELQLNKGITIKEGTKITGSRYLGKEAPLAIDPASATPVALLNSWAGDGWFPDSPSIVRLRVEGKSDELYLSAYDCGAWVKPAENAPWFNFTKWSFDSISNMWNGWTSKRMPMLAADGGLVMRVNTLPGERKFAIGQIADGKKLLDTFLIKDTGPHTPAPRLDRVKDMVLEWRDASEKHPWVVVGRQELEQLGTRNSAAYADLRDPKKLIALLEDLGKLDYMRNIMDIALRYDAVVDSGQLTPEQRNWVRARTAYLAYLVADPLHWSFERGMCSGNPNMTVSRYVNLGFMAAALKDHPMGKVWGGYVTDWAKRWLREVTDEQGSWPESAHYARVSWMDFVDFAIVARRAEFHDFFADSKFRAMAAFYEKTLTPRNPLRQTRPGDHPRVTAYYGRGTRGDAWAASGLLAAATEKSDPAFSRQMQWCWREASFNEFFSHSWGGLTHVFVDRSLPVDKPDWRSERLNAVGYLFRSHLGDERENYLLFISQYMRSPDGEIWPADTGSIANWFAYGKPISSNLTRVPEFTHPITTNRVTPATNWDPAAGKFAQPKDTGYLTTPRHDGAAMLPGVDYASVNLNLEKISEHHLMGVPANLPAYPKREKTGGAPLNWQRQMMLIGDQTPEGVNYLVLRDTVEGKQPTQWQFWNYSEKIGTSTEAGNRESFLKDKPGNATAPLRQLRGDRFTALGQFGIDTDYFIASPADGSDTARYTLRFGYQNSAYGVGGQFQEWQDLMYLQMPGDGAYFVALVPRPQGQPIPEFSKSTDGRVIIIKGPWGSDQCFMSRAIADGKSADATFRGTAASVQDRTGGLTLALAAPGEVRYGKFGLIAPHPVKMTASLNFLTLTLSSDVAQMGGQVTIESSETWRVIEARPGAATSAPALNLADVKIDKKGAFGKTITVTIPKGIASVTLSRSK